MPGVERHNGMPVTATDLSSGPAKGSVYVNFIDERNGDTDVFLLASRDGGATWAAPVRVNDDPKGAAQMFTWLAVDPADGALNVVFHDRRGLSGTMTGVTLARSVDGGRTFVNHRLPVEPFDCCAPLVVLRRLQRRRRRGRARGRRVSRSSPPPGQQRIMAAVMRFKPGTQTLMSRRRRRQTRLQSRPWRPSCALPLPPFCLLAVHAVSGPAAWAQAPAPAPAHRPRQGDAVHRRRSAGRAGEAARPTGRRRPCACSRWRPTT